MSISKISQNHKNRKAHNWLAYEINDVFLFQSRHLCRGVLYDLGAGDSPYKNFFLRYASGYVAVDWASSIHDTGPDIVADLNLEFPIETASADTVVALSVLEHLVEPQRFLSESCRILKPDGSLLLQVPWQWRLHEEPHDYFRFTPFALERLLHLAGFTEVRVEAQAGFFSMLVLKLNYFSVRLIRGPRPVRILLRGLFSVFWYLDQKLAPLLDRMDGDWSAEACGYFVTASKP